MKLFNSIAELKNALKTKKVSAVEIARHCLDIAKANKNNSFITVTEEIALNAARASQARIEDNTPLTLDGVPGSIKDLFCTKGVLTTCGSKMMANFIAPYESSSTQALINNGYIMIGKANLDQFGMGSANINSFYGPCINPYKNVLKPEMPLVPGGSSGGSAVSVAEGSALFSFGTDTGGSIRQPAAFCGLVGVKPTYGTCSRFGMISYASSMDQLGVMTNTVEDAAEILNIASFHDAKDSTSLPNEGPRCNNFAAKLNQKIKGLRIGIPKEYKVSGMHPDIMSKWEESMQKLEADGAHLVDISLPHSHHAITVYYVVSTAEASSNLARYDGIRFGYAAQGIKSLDELYIKSRSEGFGAEVKRRIMLGTFVLASENYDLYYNRAMRVRTLIKKDFDLAFQGVDVILCPTTPNLAFGLEEKISDPMLMYLNDILTVPVNLAGLPAMSIPAGISKAEGLPIGMQIIANIGQDATMMQVGHHLFNMMK